MNKKESGYILVWQECLEQMEFVGLQEQNFQ